MKNIIVAQSGGPTAVINSSCSGLVIDALKNENIDKIYGAFYGIKGVLDEDFICFNDVHIDEIKYMKTTPSAALGSCRHKITADEYEKIFEVFKKHEIGYFFYIGGNDSMDTVLKLSKYAKENRINVKIVGIPKTIDNDLVGIDHTPGFGSSAKFINMTIAEMNRDAIVYDKKLIVIVEVMGRNTGWLAASTCIATHYEGAPNLIYVPEVTFSLEKMKEDILKVLETKQQVFIVVSEGIKFANGKFVDGEENKKVDIFGHSMMGGVNNILKSYINEFTDIEVKTHEFGITQRCAIHCGSLIDIEEAFELGRNALEYAVAGSTGIMASITRLSSLPYQIKYNQVDVKLVANKEAKLPSRFINKEGNGITREGFDYFLPLIQGNFSVPKLDGLHRYTKISPLNKTCS